jgi:23S rRNA pseudouridine1911/1915/1917 synthase
MPVELAVPPEAAGERLDVFLSAHAGSRAAAQRLIDAGAVRVDGAPRPKRFVLHGGERLEVGEAPTAVEPEAPAARFEIAWQDEHLLVVDKPAGVVVHPARGNRTGTLAQALHGLAAGGEDPDRAGIVHRLDRDTSGLLLVARTVAAYDGLRAQMRARSITREYLALVEGRPPAREGTMRRSAATGACVRASPPTPTTASRR